MKLIRIGWYALLLVGCGGGATGSDSRRPDGEFPNGTGDAGDAQVSSGSGDGGGPNGAYPEGTVAFVGRYAGSYTAVNYWKWTTQTGCSYLIKPSADLSLALTSGVEFNLGAREFQVNGPSQIVVDGTSDGGQELFSNPACAPRPRIALHGTLALAAGRYSELLVWKGVVVAEQLDAHETASVEMEFPITPDNIQQAINGGDTDARNIAQSVSLIANTKPMTLGRGLDGMADQGIVSLHRQ